jgi:hypothetical protein
MKTQVYVIANQLKSGDKVQSGQSGHFGKADLEFNSMVTMQAEVIDIIEADVISKDISGYMCNAWLEYWCGEPSAGSRCSNCPMWTLCDCSSVVCQKCGSVNTCTCDRE